MRHVQEEEEASGGRVSTGQIEHDASSLVGEGGQLGHSPENKVLEGGSSILASQGSSAYGKPSCKRARSLRGDANRDISRGNAIDFAAAAEETCYVLGKRKKYWPRRLATRCPSRIMLRFCGIRE